MATPRDPTHGSPAAEQRRHTPEQQATPTPPRTTRDRVILLQLGGAHPGSIFTVCAPGALIGRNDSASVTISDASVSGEHARLTLGEDGAHVEDVGSRNGTFVNEQRIKSRTPLNEGDYLRLGVNTVLKFSRADEFEERALRTLSDLTLRDPLTRLHNRRYFDDRLRGEFAFAQRHDAVLGLLLIGIDHIKLLNAQHGHPMGDVVLKLIAISLQTMVRPEDVLARYGGEEFVVIVRATSVRNLEILGMRMCHRVQALPLQFENPALPVNVRVGVACMSPHAHYATAEALLAAVGEALCNAKASGTTRVCVALPSDRQGARAARPDLNGGAPHRGR